MLARYRVKHFVLVFHYCSVGYRRAGCTYKKAIITFEASVPQEVKMLQSSRNLGANPHITKQNVSYGDTASFAKSRKRSVLDLAYSGWKLPVQTLLAGMRTSLLAIR